MTKYEILIENTTQFNLYETKIRDTIKYKIKIRNIIKHEIKTTHS